MYFCPNCSYTFDITKSSASNVDYNDLKVSYYGNNGHHYNLLGAVSDRIEAFLMRRKWNKITADRFAKLKLEIDEKRT